MAPVNKITSSKLGKAAVARAAIAAALSGWFAFSSGQQRLRKYDLPLAPHQAVRRLLRWRENTFRL